MKLLFSLIITALCLNCGACELLVKAVSVAHPDPDEDRRGRTKRGMIVVVMPDGHQWGDQERLPKFVVIKIPGVSVAKALKYIQPQMIQDGFEEDGTTTKMTTYRARLWQLRWDDLPLAARNKLATTGGLTIKVGTYGGAFDYTWAQVKAFFRNLETGLDETEDL